MILIALGANLPGPAGPPRAQCEAAFAALEKRGVAVVKRSRWYESAPVPASDQPNFVNGVAAISTALRPAELLQTLHAVEAELGRVRGAPNAARTLDLDLLDYDGLVQEGPPILPHPRIASRDFVLLPLADVAPDWAHPLTRLSVATLIAALPAGRTARPLP
jgi:2-amino-4-hydroxy-6-hydroxymethyldihydropteridine diphosphokinase